MEGGEMSKYVIEIKPEYEDKIRGVMILGAENSNLYLDSMAVDELEELNSDYINEHFSDLQDTAYQRGLDDAWEAARKIALMDTETSENVTGYFGLFRIVENLTPMQALEKLKAYEEQKADDEIKVGDEVVNKTTGTKGILLEPETEHLLATVIIPSQRWGTFYASHVNLKKTGKHYDIEKILEEMRQ